jgi:hypothetical protein
MVLGGTLALLGGCLSPTLPLPPPDEPQVESAGQGLVSLSGRVPKPNAPVIAVNNDTGAYAGDDADEAGRYWFQIAAEPGDHMEIWYLDGNDRSDDRVFEIPRFELEAMAPPAVTAPDADGVVSISGLVPEPLAQVFVSNLATEVTDDVPSDEEGRFSIQIAAESGDQLELWYKYGSDFSPITLVDVP